MADEIKYTNLTALEAAKALAEQAANTPLVEKLTAMVTAENNRRERAKNAEKGESKEVRATMLKAAETIRAMAEHGNEPMTCQRIGELVNDMTTSHKVSGVMNQPRKKGLVTYGPKEKGKVTYVATPAGIEWAANPVPFKQLPDVEQASE